MDYIPDAAPILGYSEDLAAIMMVYNQLKDSLTPEGERKPKDKLSEWFGKDINCQDINIGLNNGDTFL